MKVGSMPNSMLLAASFVSFQVIQNLENKCLKMKTSKVPEVS